MNIRYYVPPVEQGSNPVCWVACAAMIKNYRGQSTQTLIGDLLEGYDPSNSSIPNPSQNGSLYPTLESWGFGHLMPNGFPSEYYLKTILSNRGPVILFHYVNGFNYGPRGFGSSSTQASHAVVITGIDTVKNKTYFSNPWGNNDVEADTMMILRAMDKYAKSGRQPLSYLK